MAGSTQASGRLLSTGWRDRYSRSSLYQSGRFLYVCRGRGVIRRGRPGWRFEWLGWDGLDRLRVQTRARATRPHLLARDVEAEYARMRHVVVGGVHRVEALLPRRVPEVDRNLLACAPRPTDGKRGWLARPGGAAARPGRRDGAGPQARAALRTVDRGIVSEERERVRRELPLLVVAQLRRNRRAGSSSAAEWPVGGTARAVAAGLSWHATHQEALHQLRLSASRVAKQNDFERVLALRIWRGSWPAGRVVRAAGGRGGGAGLHAPREPFGPIWDELLGPGAWCMTFLPSSPPSASAISPRGVGTMATPDGRSAKNLGIRTTGLYSVPIVRPRTCS